LFEVSDIGHSSGCISDSLNRSRQPIHDQADDDECNDAEEDFPFSANRRDDFGDFEHSDAPVNNIRIQEL